MRIRSIKPEFWRSDDISSLEWDDRLIFVGLWSYVDDNGVGVDRLSSIVADLFAGDIERDSSDTFARVSRGLQNLFSSGRIDRYMVEGKRYLCVINWERHQRIDKPNKDRYPRPDCDLEVIRDTLARVTEKEASGTEEQRNRGTEEEVLMSTSGERERAPKSPYSTAFEEWWSHYPKKESKGDAWKAWETTRRARTMPELAALIAATAAYTRKTKGGDQQFVKLPAGWLRDRKWEDEPAPAESAGWGHLRRLGGAA